MADFLLKLPVFQLEGGKRGLMVMAKVVGFGEADVTLYTDDNRTIGVRMPVSRVQNAAQNGPFVALAEVKDIGSGERVNAGLKLVGPDGNPL